MATIRFYLDVRRPRKSDGKSQLQFQINHKGKTSLVPLGMYLLPGEWDAVGQRVTGDSPAHKRMDILLRKWRLDVDVAMLDTPTCGMDAKGVATVAASLDIPKETIAAALGKKDGGKRMRELEKAKLMEKAPEMVKRGVESLRSLADGKDRVENAMERNDLEQYGGTAAISFDWGKPGNPDKGYKGGFGISHIFSKHGAETLGHIIDVIASGDIVRHVEGNKTVVIGKDGYEAVLALTRDGNKESWLLSGWNTDLEKEKADVQGEVSAQSRTTQTNPTFSREDLGAALSDAKITNIFDKVTNAKEKALRIRTRGSLPTAWWFMTWRTRRRARRLCAR